MKNLSLIINAVLAVAVIVLFWLVLGGSKTNPVAQQIVSGKTTGKVSKLPIAFINVDSLLLNYQFAKDANESLIKKIV
jgi:outer membrane protein